MSKPGVMIYFDTAEAIKDLDFETKGKLFDAILSYAETGTLPDLDGVARAVFPFVRQRIDADSARYDAAVEQRKKAGQRSASCKKQRALTGVEFRSTGVNETNQLQLTKTNSTSNSIIAFDNTGASAPPAPDKPKRTKFVPPTIDEVRMYCIGQNLNIDVARFVDYYESTGWHVGKNAMKDWKAAARNWARPRNDENLKEVKNVIGTNSTDDSGNAEQCKFGVWL